MLSSTVALLRASVGVDLDDARLEDLIAELSLESEEFRRLWAQQDVRIALTGDTGYRHPVVGALRLRYQTLAVGGDDGQTILVVHAAPGSRDAEALARLATLAAEFDTAMQESEPPRRVAPDADSPAIAAAPGVRGASGCARERCAARGRGGRNPSRQLAERNVREVAVALPACYLDVNGAAITRSAPDPSTGYETSLQGVGEVLSRTSAGVGAWTFDSLGRWFAVGGAPTTRSRR
jgi:MmyB-like transcription regulator ligand binding domain